MLDTINACFVVAAAGLAWLDVWVLFKSQSLRGLHMGTACLFTVWPLWDLVYYAGLHQTLSLMACCVLVMGRAAWLSQAVIYYGR